MDKVIMHSAQLAALFLAPHALADEVVLVVRTQVGSDCGLAVYSFS